MTPGPVYKYVEKWNSLYLCCQYPWCVLAVRRLNISRIARWRLPRLTVHCSVIVSGPQLGRTVWSWCGKEKGRLANRNIKCECVHVGTNPNGGCQQFHNRLTPIYTAIQRAFHRQIWSQTAFLHLILVRWSCIVHALLTVEYSWTFKICLPQ